MWSAIRWQTFNIVASFVGGKALAEKGIHKPTDMLQFPWEKPSLNITNDEIAQMQAEMKWYQEMMRNERQDNTEHDNMATALQ